MEYKFRAWDSYQNKMYSFSELNEMELRGYLSFWNLLIGEVPHMTLMMYTGLKDKNGVELFFNDLVNVYWTSGDGEHIHDCIFEVVMGLLGIEFRFIKLLWENYGWNQYPVSNTLCEKYNSLTLGADGLEIPNSWEETANSHRRWKSNDRSSYFVKIGGRYTTPELLEE